MNTLDRAKDEVLFMGDHATKDMALHCDLMFWLDDEGLLFQASVNYLGQYCVTLHNPDLTPIEEQ